jgi:hypothetical protein
VLWVLEDFLHVVAWAKTELLQCSFERCCTSAWKACSDDLHTRLSAANTKRGNFEGVEDTATEPHFWIAVHAVSTCLHTVFNWLTSE